MTEESKYQLQRRRIVEKDQFCLTQIKSGIWVIDGVKGIVLSGESGKTFPVHLCPNDYHRFTFEGTYYRTHRVVLIATQGLPPAGITDACHRDHCKANNAASNLYWASRSENIKHSIRDGKFKPVGFAYSQRKITDEEHASMLQLRESGWSIGELCRHFKLCRSTCSSWLARPLGKARNIAYVSKPFKLVDPKGLNVYQGTNLKGFCGAMRLNYQTCVGARRRGRPFAGGWRHLPIEEEQRLAA